jgi:hypothetical protein
MTTTNQFVFVHQNHPLYAAARHLYRSLHPKEYPRSAKPKVRQLDRLATQLLIHVAEAIDIPSLRWRRLESALHCIIRVNPLLEALFLDDAIEQGDFARIMGELTALAGALEAFSNPGVASASKDPTAEPVEAATTVLAGPPRAPDAEVESPAPSNGSGALSQVSEGPEEGANGYFSAAGAADPRLARTGSDKD